MKALVTGLNGTLGQALKTALRRRRWQVHGWDRVAVGTDHYTTMENYVREQKPEVLFHLAIATQPTSRENESWHVHYEWTSELAWICRQLDIRFVFTSSVMVFCDSAPGPFTLASQPDATEGYGWEKRLAEEQVFFQNPQATVARLGWQIGEKPGGNHMLDYLENQVQRHGQITASELWLPACSFLTDTAAGLCRLAAKEPGLYLLDSNRKWNFFEIAVALNERYQKEWQIEKTSDFRFDQRMIDERPKMPPLSRRLKTLPK